MQRADQVSLNSLRVFAAAAERQSFTGAAGDLGVTPGAVSRQVLSLEDSLGVRLFQRRNNVIELTEHGEQLYYNVQPGLLTLHRAIQATLGTEIEISVRVPSTLATRWLIPRLDDFRRRWPDTIVRFETYGEVGVSYPALADVMLAYVPVDHAGSGGRVLFEDRCRPYLSPHLLAQISNPSDLSSIPALQCSDGNWDWSLWLREAGFAQTELSYAGHFDLDDAALRAAIAGLGMVLSSEVVIQDDLEAGRLCPVPNLPEILLGRYEVSVANPVPDAAARFVRWLFAQT